MKDFRNKVYCIDNLKLLCKIPNESIDLVYIDPPFFTQRDHKTIEGVGFKDNFENIIHYIEWMKVRVIEIHRILKKTGSLFLHCDWRTSHYIRFMLDEVFGVNNFRNEIIWCYNGGGISKKMFSRKHDNIYFYSKNSDYKFNRQYQPYSKASSKLISKRGGKSIDNKPRNLKRGSAMTDWWSSINSLQTWSSERKGYPTQKPEALLKRIIMACSNEGDIIADFFCGSGTTLAVAKRLGRQYIACDSNPDAVKITKDRLNEILERSDL